MRVLVADDHAMMRDALVGAILMIAPAADVVPVGSFDAAIAAPGPWTLILSDLAMPGAAPLAGIGKVMAAHSGTPLLVVTGNEEDGLLLALLAAGVAGFVPKTSSATVIEAAIRLVLAGGHYLPERVAALALSSPIRPAHNISPAAPATAITARQREVLQAIATGQSTKQIAQALNIAPATVKAHTATLLDLLGASNRMQAVSQARALGLI